METTTPIGPKNSPEIPVQPQTVQNSANNNKVLLPFILVGLVLLVIIGVATYYLEKKNKDVVQQNQYVNPKPIDDPQYNVLASPTYIPTDNWIIYKSQAFNYSFKYPTTWSISMFKESDPKILFGTNSLQNYSPTEVEKYMDHGLIDWTSYIKDKPAIKIDFAVYSKTPGPNQYEDKKEFLDNLLNKLSKKLDISDLTISNLPTDQYKVTEDLGPTDVPEINTFVAYPDNDRIIYMNLLFWNIKDYEQLKNTPQWKEFKQIVSTFKFTE